MGTVATSIASGETCTPVCSETVESPSSADEESQVNSQLVEISVENTDSKRGTQKLEVASGSSYTGEHVEGGGGPSVTGVLLKQFILGK